MLSDIFAQQSYCMLALTYQTILWLILYHGSHKNYRVKLQKHNNRRQSCVTHLLCESAGAESPNIVLKLLGAELAAASGYQRNENGTKQNKTHTKKQPKSLNPG